MIKHFILSCDGSIIFQQKMKMVAYIESPDLIDVSFGASKEYYEDENHLLDDGERAYARMCMVMTPNIRISLNLLNVHSSSGEI